MNVYTEHDAEIRVRHGTVNQHHPQGKPLIGG
jgi:hypothetical protein